MGEDNEDGAADEMAVGEWRRWRHESGGDGDVDDDCQGGGDGVAGDQKWEQDNYENDGYVHDDDIKRRSCNQFRIGYTTLTWYKPPNKQTRNLTPQTNK